MFYYILTGYTGLCLLGTAGILSYLRNSKCRAIALNNKWKFFKIYLMFIWAYPFAFIYAFYRVIDEPWLPFKSLFGVLKFFYKHPYVATQISVNNEYICDADDIELYISNYDRDQYNDIINNPIKKQIYEDFRKSLPDNDRAKLDMRLAIFKYARLNNQDVILLDNGQFDYVLKIRE